MPWYTMIDNYGDKFRNIDKYSNNNVENAYYVDNIMLRYNGNHARETRLKKEKVLANRARTRNRRARMSPELKRADGKRNLLGTRRNTRQSRVRNWMPKL